MTVRKVVTRRSCHFRGYFPSLKNGKAVPWESQLEGAFLRLLELSPQVLRYAVQPSRERFVTNGGVTTYYPDVYAILHDGAERWFEVKPADKLLHRRIETRMEAIAIHFKQNNRVFSVISDEDLLVEPFYENLCELMYHRRSEMLISGSPEHLSLLLKEHGPKTVSELGDLFGQGLAWRLLGLGYIGLDLEKPLLPSSPIYLKGGHRHGNFFA